MFTGIVEATGEIRKAEDGVLWVAARTLEGAETGASVAVSGVCLTVTERDGDLCRFDVSDETLARTSLGSLAAGDRVNLERPLRAGDELGGHFVQGHVDGVGRVERQGERLAVSCDADLLRYVVEKGSITVDGVSLTVTSVQPSGFEVALIPHTLEVTTLGEAEVGDAVNLEVDVVAKYVERLITPWRTTVAQDPGDAGYL